MNWQYTPYVLPLIAAAIITAALALVAMRRRPMPGAAPFAWMMVAVTVWSVCYGLEVGGADLPTILFWSNAKYLGIAFLPVAWLAFALQYSGREKWLTRLNVTLLALAPLATQLVIWTDAAHRLFREDVQVVSSGSFLTLQVKSGPWFGVHTAYSYLLIGLGLVLLVRALIRAPRMYRGQAATLIVGAAVPLVANVVYVVFFQQALPLDPTPFCFTVTGLVFAWGLFRFRLLDVVPVARNAVIEGMSDGVLVLNAQNHIVDLNPAAQRIIGGAAARLEAVVGQSIEQALSEQPDLVEHCRDVTEAQAEIALRVDEQQRRYDMRLSPLYDPRQRFTGRLIVLRDITERKQAEESRERWVAQLQVMPEVARSIVAIPDLDELLNHSVNLLRDRLGFYHVGIFLVDERGESAVLKAVTPLTPGGPPPQSGGLTPEGCPARKRGQGVLRASAGEAGSQTSVSLVEPMLKPEYPLRVGEASIVGLALSSGQVRIARADSARLEHPLLPETRAEIALPLKVGQRVIGALDVHSKEAAFDDAAIAVLQTVTDQLAVAIENARLLQEMQATVRELERASGRYTEEAWRALASRAGRPYGYRYQRDGVEPTTALYPEAEQAWQQGQPVVTTVRPEAEGDTLRAGMIGALAVPIRVRDQVVGALDVRLKDQSVPPETASLIQEVANRLSLTIESARLYQDSQRRAAREQLTRQITDRMRRTVDMDSLLQTTIREMTAALGTSGAFVQLSVPNEPVAKEME